jgi:hypothetical protein
MNPERTRREATRDGTVTKNSPKLRIQRGPGRKMGPIERVKELEQFYKAFEASWIDLAMGQEFTGLRDRRRRTSNNVRVNTEINRMTKLRAAGPFTNNHWIFAAPSRIMGPLDFAWEPTEMRERVVAVLKVNISKPVALKIGIMELGLVIIVKGHRVVTGFEEGVGVDRDWIIAIKIEVALENLDLARRREMMEIVMTRAANRRAFKIKDVLKIIIVGCSEASFFDVPFLVANDLAAHISIGNTRRRGSVGLGGWGL